MDFVGYAINYVFNISVVLTKIPDTFWPHLVHFFKPIPTFSMSREYICKLFFRIPGNVYCETNVFNEQNRFCFHFMSVITF